MKPEKALKLRAALEKIHQNFVFENQIAKDAIAPATIYKRPLDCEFAAFICAILAYGKVAHIQSSTRKILTPMGPEPVEWLRNSTVRDLKKITQGWVHRFNKSEDMLLMLLLLKEIYSQFESMEHFLELQLSDTAETVLHRLHKKIRTLSAKLPKKGSSFWFLLPHPETGSACKRLNLYLRWMVGSSEMDFGFWKKFDKKQLIIPVDTHVLKQARRLNLTRRKTADWKTAVEITNQLKFLDPHDPTRFDFALCHIGITRQSLD